MPAFKFAFFRVIPGFSPYCEVAEIAEAVAASLVSAFFADTRRGF
jgi:hypothetical protein